MINHLKLFGLYLLFFSLPIVATLKGKGIVISLIVAFFLVRGPKAIVLSLKKVKPNLLFIFSLILFIDIAFFSIRDVNSILPFARLILLYLCGYYTVKGASALSPLEKDRFKKAFTKGMIFYTGFMLIECYTGIISFLYTGTAQYNPGLFLRGVVILTFLSVPFWFALESTKHPKTYQALFAGVLCFILLKAQPSAARVAVIVAVTLCALLHFRHFLKVFFIALGLWILAAPFVFLYGLNRTHLFSVLHWLPSSYQHRIQIWEVFSKKIIEAPWIGHGFNSRFMDAEKIEKICLHYKLSVPIPKIPQLGSELQPWGKVVCFDEPVITTHPHNGVLQIWFEGGLLGVALTLSFLWFLYRVLRDTSPQDQRIYLGVIGLSIVYWNISFGLWQNWMIAVVSLTIALIPTIKGLPKRERTHV